MPPPDLSKSYNTQLSPEQEQAYEAWVKALSEKNGRNMTKDTYDYDLRGAYAAGEGQSENGHFTDKFKKPNHPTFSNESQYSGNGDLQGGQWTQDAEGNDVFTPGPANLKNFTPAELKDYWAKAEDDKTKLNLPSAVEMFPNSNMAP